MGKRERLNRILEKIEEKQGNRPILILFGDVKDNEQKKLEFEKVHGKDHDTIIIRYEKRGSITQ